MLQKNSVFKWAVVVVYTAVVAIISYNVGKESVAQQKAVKQNGSVSQKGSSVLPATDKNIQALPPQR